MVTVKKANVVLNIEDEEIDKYCEKGFSVLDQNGNVIKAGAPKDIGALQKLVQDKDIEIAELKQEIERLKAQAAFVAEKKSYNKKKTQEL